MEIEILDNAELPEGFQYPKDFLRLIELGMVNYDVWYFFDKNSIRIRYEGLQKRYPYRNLIPFARRGDNDDIACFELNKGETVQIIHDFASAGYEQRQVYEKFWDWFREAIEEMINFD